MRPGEWFSEVSKSLRDGFFADNVVLALARVKRDSAVTEDQKELFGRAYKLLSDAIAGYEWIDKPTFTAESANHASLFGQVVRALTISSAPADFVAYLGDVRGTAERLANGRVPKASEINKLRRFFANHSRAEMEHSDQLFAPKGRGPSAWNLMM
jgi:hypothetical protein